MTSEMRGIVDGENIPANVEIFYENFMSEMEANVDLQDDVMGKPIKYGSKFQLVQESSKRFVCIHEATNDQVKKIFKDEGYIDSYCFTFGFDEYPSSRTHFSFKECSSFQREGPGTVKDDHFLYLTTIYKAKQLSLARRGTYLVMTQSYKSALKYDLVRESDTFDEIEDVQSSEVVLLTYANDAYYLNVPDPEAIVEGEEHDVTDQHILFEGWQDYKDIDFNGWFMLEFDDETQKVHLKHFNTGKYMIINNGDDIFQDYAGLSEERSPNSEVVFEPVNTENENVMGYTTNTIFKIRAYSVGADAEKNYLRFATPEDSEKLQEKISKDKDEDATLDTEGVASNNFLVVKDACPINKFDTFNLVFPNDDTYRELVFCKDMYVYLNTFLSRLKSNDDVLSKLPEVAMGLYKIFDKVYRFLNNELEGRINADYDIGEIVEYRQQMIAKVGILGSIFELLREIRDTNTDADDDDFNEQDEKWSEQVHHIFSLHGKIQDDRENREFNNTLDLIFETLY